MIFFERLKCCISDAVVPPVTPGAGALPHSYRFHVSVRRDGRLYVNRLEIDPDQAQLESILLEVHYEDEIHGKPDDVYVAEYEMDLDHDLMSTIERTGWERSVELPQASVLAVAVKIRCLGGDTEWLWAWPAGADSLQVMTEPETPLPPVRTMGHKQYQFAVRMVRPVQLGSEAQSLEDACEEVKAGEAQTFYRAYADISDSFAKGSGHPPIDIPGTVSQFEPTDFGGTGTLTVSGSPGKAAVTLRVNGDAEIALVVIVENTTLAACATDLAAAINASLFGDYFSAVAAGTVVTLTQLRNYIGTLTAATSPVPPASSAPWSVAAAGITPAGTMLNISVGRKYCVQFEGPGGVSAASPLSISTGPVRGSKIVIHGIPPAGADVTDIHILATADGQDGPFVEVASVAAGSLTANDVTTTATGGTDPVETCDVRDGIVYVTVKKQGADWFDVQIDSNQQRSEIIDAPTLGRLEENTIISADIRHVLELPPTLEKPGRPCDVRVVIE